MPTPLPAPARGSVQSLQAGVPAGGNRGKERSTGGVVLDQVPLDPPSLGKRSRPPKDVPWRIKRSRPMVGGDLAPTRPGSPLGRDRGWDRCVSSSRHSRPATQGEGRAVSQGILTEDSVKPSQPEGGVTQARPPSPPRSTRHTGARDLAAPSFHAFHHHDQFHLASPRPQVAPLGSGIGSFMDPASALPHPGSQDPEQDDLEDPWDRISEADFGVQSGLRIQFHPPFFSR